MSIKSTLARLGSTFHYTITSTGYDAAKEQFTYKVTLNGQSFDYFMCVGHAKDPVFGRNYRIKSASYYMPVKGQWLCDKSVSGTDFRNWWLSQPDCAPFPDLSDIFECLLSDCSAGAQSFEEFASDFGYDSDSHSARETHRACRENLCKLVAALGFETLAKLERAAQDNNSDSDDSA